MFGTKRDLFVIHNMGRSCPSCTLWADGCNGYTRTSPIARPPDVQQSFAASRGWRFPMVSHQGSSFAADRPPSGGWLPGVSVFRREGNSIVRVANTGFEPADDFCALWHLLDLLPEGAAEWQPKFYYR